MAAHTYVAVIEILIAVINGMVGRTAGPFNEPQERAMLLELDLLSFFCLVGRVKVFLFLAVNIAI